MLAFPVVEERDGIRIFGGLKPIAVTPGRRVYRALILDRFSKFYSDSFLCELNCFLGWAGHQGNTIDWTTIKENWSTWVNEEAIPMTKATPGQPSRRAQLLTTNSMRSIDIKAWLAFFAKHQDPDNEEFSWEDGMIFRPVQVAVKKARKIFEG